VARGTCPIAAGAFPRTTIRLAYMYPVSLSKLSLSQTPRIQLEIMGKARKAPPRLGRSCLGASGSRGPLTGGSSRLLGLLSAYACHYMLAEHLTGVDVIRHYGHYRFSIIYRHNVNPSQRAKRGGVTSL
jgi:hypothetical protein